MRAPSVMLGSRSWSLLMRVQGEQHGLQPVDALLLLQLAARLAVVPPRVHREEPAQGDVPVDADGVQVGVARCLWLGRRGGDGHLERQEEEEEEEVPAAAASRLATTGPPSLRAPQRGHHESPTTTHPKKKNKSLEEMGQRMQLHKRARKTIRRVGGDISSTHALGSLEVSSHVSQP